jgi:hypothetical protein
LFSFTVFNGFNPRSLYESNLNGDAMQDSQDITSLPISVVDERVSSGRDSVIG